MEHMYFKIEDYQLLLLISVFFIVMSVAGLFAGFLSSLNDTKTDAAPAGKSVASQPETIHECLQNRFNVLEARFNWVRQRLADIGLKQDAVDSVLHNVDTKATAEGKDTADGLEVSREIKKDIMSLAGDIQDIKCDMVEASAKMTGSQSGTDTALLDKLGDMVQAFTTRIIEANKTNIDAELKTNTNSYRVLEEEVKMLRLQSASDKKCSAVTEEMIKASAEEIIEATKKMVSEGLVVLSREIEAIKSKQSELGDSQQDLKSTINTKMVIVSSNAFNVSLAKRSAEMSDKISRNVLKAWKTAQTEKTEVSAQPLTKLSLVAAKEIAVTEPMLGPGDTRSFVDGTKLENSGEEKDLRSDKASKKHEDETRKQSWAEKVEGDIDTAGISASPEDTGMPIDKHVPTSAELVNEFEGQKDKAATNDVNTAKKKPEAEKATKRCNKCEKEFSVAEHNIHHNKCTKKRCRNCGDFFDQMDLVKYHNKVCFPKDGSKRPQPSKSASRHQQAPPNAPKGPRQNPEPHSRPIKPQGQLSTADANGPISGSRWENQETKKSTFETKGGSGIGGSKYAS